MTSPTRQFSWKDRDTAAHDLLQLAYHAPPSIARQALELLQAIRSPAIIPELLAILEDHQRDTWQRIYALRSITQTPGKWHLPQLKGEMTRILQRRGAIRATHPNPERAYLGNDLLDDLCGLTVHHPKNRDWFFSALDEADNPAVVRGFITDAINYEQPEAFREILIDYLLELLNSHPTQIDASVVKTLVWADHPKSWVWLNQNVDRIVSLLATDVTNRAVLSIAEQFEAARKKLTDLVPGFEDAFNTYRVETTQLRAEGRAQRKEHLSDFHLSPAYTYLADLHQRADNHDKAAYQRLVSIARKWQGDIPLRAVATHLLGKLGHKYDITGILCQLLKYGQDDWGHASSPLSPVRTEAGEVLKNTPSPQVWEVMMDAFFINVPNMLATDMLAWIAHLTDMLDGVCTAYAGKSWGPPDRRLWFRALAEISEEQLQQDTGMG